MRHEVFYEYRLGVRLAHAATIVLLILLYWSGLRLGSLFALDGLVTPGNWLDGFVYDGRVFLLHRSLGVYFLLVGIFYVTHLLLTDQLRRLLNIFTHRRYQFRKKLLFLAMLFTGLMMAVSGLTMYYGLFSGGGGFALMKAIHQYGAVALALMTLIHIVSVITDKESRANSIFLQRVFPGFWGWRALILSGALALALNLAGVYWSGRSQDLQVVNSPQAITVDGLADEPIWSECDSITIPIWGGSGFAFGTTKATVKAVQHRNRFHFLISWDDPEISFNREMIKTEDGWQVRQSEFLDRFGERIFWEDQLAVSLSQDRFGCAATCHMDRGERLGYHLSRDSLHDLWLWSAVSSNPVGQADDRFWTTELDSSGSGARIDNPLAIATHTNFHQDWNEPYLVPTAPLRYPAIIADDPYSAPYFREDDTSPVGSKLPSVVVSSRVGDRADVVSRGRWHGGRWTVEFARRLDTGSSNDLAIEDGLFLSIAAFNHARFKHAFHLHPVRLRLE